MNNIEINDVVYLDPPNIYHDTKRSYTQLRFDIRETEVLYGYIRDLHMKNIRFITHNIKVDSILKHVNDKNFFFFNVGVKGASMKTLEKLSSPEMPPAKLEGLKFAEFFQWLSASIQIVAASNDLQKETIDLPSPANWMEGFKIS